MAHFGENLDHELAHGRLVIYNQNGKAGLSIVDFRDRVWLVYVFSSPPPIPVEGVDIPTSLTGYAAAP